MSVSLAKKTKIIMNWAEHKYTRSFDFTRSSGCAYRWQNHISIKIARSDFCKAKLMFVLFVKLYFQKLIGFTIGTQSRTFSILYHCERRRRDFFECVYQFPFGNPCFRAFQRPKNTVNPWKTLENTQKIQNNTQKIFRSSAGFGQKQGGFLPRNTIDVIASFTETRLRNIKFSIL